MWCGLLSFSPFIDLRNYEECQSGCAQRRGDCTTGGCAVARGGRTFMVAGFLHCRSHSGDGGSAGGLRRSLEEVLE
jgi:hypothetical protein